MVGRVFLVEGLVDKELGGALDGVAQWIECQTANQGVTGSIPSQGTSLGCGPGHQLGAHERQPHIDVSPSFSPSLPPSLKIKINKKF